MPGEANVLASKVDSKLVKQKKIKGGAEKAAF